MFLTQATSSMASHYQENKLQMPTVTFEYCQQLAPMYSFSELPPHTQSFRNLDMVSACHFCIVVSIQNVFLCPSLLIDMLLIYLFQELLQQPFQIFFQDVIRPYAVTYIMVSISVIRHHIDKHLHQRMLSPPSL